MQLLNILCKLAQSHDTRKRYLRLFQFMLFFRANYLKYEVNFVTHPQLLSEVIGI